jgi:tRNA threonylcarbamoyladenosine biosynthesis protein TsaB
MKILALESSAMTASAAIVTEELVMAEYTIDHKKTHSQTLLSMIDEMVRMADMELSEIDAIAVSAGPGSFTGLRIGSATAKGLGLALDKPLISVPTMDAMAYNMYGSDKLVCPIMDARRTQVYTGIYEFNDSFYVLKKQDIVLIKDLVEELNVMNREVIFLGDGVLVNREYIENNMKVPYTFAPLHLNRSKASSVGALGMELYRAGQAVHARDHVPDYLRATQAERELSMQKEKA